MTVEGARFRRSPAAAAVLTAVVLALAVWMVTGSPVFDVREVHVTGAHMLGRNEVRRISAVTPGENLLHLSVDAVERSLLRSPWISAVRVSRSFPATLTIQVAERRPVGWLADPEGRVVLARDGTVLERVETAPRDLPELGSSPVILHPGDRPENPGPSLLVAATLPGGLLGDVKTVGVGEGEVVLDLRGGGQVRYGPPTDLPAKHRAAAGMLVWAQEQGIVPQYLDVRLPTAPALLPA